LFIPEVNIYDDFLIIFARLSQGDIRHAASILEEIKDVMSDFRTVVSDMGIEDSVRDVIDKHIQRQVQYLDHSD